MSKVLETAVSKIPAVTFGFWVIKIIATTLGETGGDAVTMTLGLGYLVGTVIFATMVIIVLAAQIRAVRFYPFLYWGVIIATTTAGTTLADLVDRSLGIGYAGGASILFAMVIVILVSWHSSLGSVAVATVTTPRAEAFYWSTIMFSQTLGTALGDWMAATGLGYEHGAIVFASGLSAVALAYFYTNMSRAVLFWAAFIFTRPLGAMIGDLLDKPVSNGGFALGRFSASITLMAIIVACIILIPQRAGSDSGHWEQQA